MGGVILVILFFLMGSCLSMFIPNIWQLLTALRYVLFFCIGYVLRKYCSSIEPPKMLMVGLLMLVVNTLCFGILELNLMTNKVLLVRLLTMGIRCLCEVSGAIMAFFLLSAIASKIPYNNKYIKGLYRVSFPIYLFHQQIIYLLLWNLKDFLNPYIMTFVNFLGALIVSWLISAIMMSNKYTRFLIGAK